MSRVTPRVMFDTILLYGSLVFGGFACAASTRTGACVATLDAEDSKHKRAVE